MPYGTIGELEQALRQASYLPERGLATALFLSLRLEKPLLLEGEAGVGKTEAAKALAAALPARLIRLQCYEGLDVAHAVYEWNYSRQLLHIRAAQEGTVSEEELFGREFLIRRPLLEAIESEEPVVLLIDEIDRADDEFEAFLLEVLSDFQISIPEIGTVRARRQPSVILTSNRTRELHDAPSAAACSTGSATRASSGRWRSCACGCPACRAARRSGDGVRARAAPARPGQAAGRRRDDRLGAGARGAGAAGARRGVVESTLGSVLKYYEDTRDGAGHGSRPARRRGSRRCPLTFCCGMSARSGACCARAAWRSGRAGWRTP